MVIVIVMPCDSTRVLSRVASLVHSHSGYPTAAIFHSLIEGGGPTFGTLPGRVSFATADRATAGTSTVCPPPLPKVTQFVP